MVIVLGFSKVDTALEFGAGVNWVNLMFSTSHRW